MRVRQLRITDNQYSHVVIVAAVVAVAAEVAVGRRLHCARPPVQIPPLKPGQCVLAANKVGHPEQQGPLAKTLKQCRQWSTAATAAAVVAGARRPPKHRGVCYNNNNDNIKPDMVRPGVAISPHNQHLSQRRR